MFKREGGGANAFRTMLKKTALFLRDGFPKECAQKFPEKCQK